MDKIKLGQIGEEMASMILIEEGYEIIERNYKCPLGEVDIIASKGNEVLFVEVKTRKSITMGRPAEAVTRKKKVHIINTANAYIKSIAADNRLFNLKEKLNYRFNVMEIMINNIENAF